MITGLDLPDFRYAAETVIAVSLLMVTVLLTRRYIARQFGAGVAYALWIIPVARLVLPPLPSPMSVMGFLGIGASSAPVQEAIWTRSASETIVHVPVNAGTAGLAPPPAHEIVHPPAMADGTPIFITAPETTNPLLGSTILTILLFVWAGGAAFVFARSFLAHRSFMQTVRREAAPVSPELSRLAEQVARQVGLKRMPRVSSSFISSGPLVTGLFRPVVLLPAWFEADYDRTQQRAALAHELTHVKRGDLWALQISELVLALLWFNPLAYYSRRAFRTDQEAACDSDVLKCGATSPHEYGQTLLKAVQVALPERLTAAASLPLTHALKERMLRMTNPAPSRSRRLMGAGIAGLLGSAALMATASVTATAEEKETRNISITNGTVYIDGEKVEDRQIVVLGDPFRVHMPDHAIELEIEELSKQIELESMGIDVLLENMPEMDMAFDGFDKELAGTMAFAFSFEDGEMPKTEAEWEEWAEKIEANAEIIEARAEEWAEKFEAKMEAWEMEFEPKMEAFEIRIEALSDQLEDKIEMHFGEDFEARMESTHNVVVDLTRECRDANLADGETRILKSKTEDGEAVKIACVKGGPAALKAKATVAKIKASKDLSDAEKASFVQQTDGNNQITIDLDD